MYVNTLFCGIALVLQAFILVESHVWLMERGHTEDAERMLTKVRGDSGAAKAELGSILNNIEERKRLKDAMPKQSKLKTFVEIFTNGTFLRPFSVSFIIVLGTILIGLNIINQFFVFILEEGNCPIEPHIAAACLTTYRYRRKKAMEICRFFNFTNYLKISERI